MGKDHRYRETPGRSRNDAARSADDPVSKSNGWLNPTVAGAGITIALGDFCYETTTVLLPGFLAVLGLPASALGMIEGVADSVAASPRWYRRKRLVLIDYGLTPVGQALIALAVGWLLILLGRITSWFGKGLRGALRDAIVVQVVTLETMGRASGFTGLRIPSGSADGARLLVFGEQRAAARRHLLCGRLVCHRPKALESTVTAEMVEADTLATSYGTLGVINGTAKFISSATVGVVWTAVSQACGFGLAALLMTVGSLALLSVRNS